MDSLFLRHNSDRNTALEYDERFMRNAVNIRLGPLGMRQKRIVQGKFTIKLIFP